MCVVSAETTGGGPLGHPVSSMSVSRSGGRRKSIFPGKFRKNLRLPPMGKLNLRLPPNLTTKIPKSENFDFPKLAPERSWGNAGMVGHAETCSKHTAVRPRPVTRFFTSMMLSRQSMGMPRNLGFLKISSSKKHQIFETANFRFSKLAPE